MSTDRSKYLENFREEIEGHLATLNNAVLEIETGQWDEDTMKSFMRIAHSMKGSARMMGFTIISNLSHKIEDVIGAIRENRIQATSSVIDVLFEGLDAISKQVASVMDGQPEQNSDQILSLLSDVNAGRIPPESATHTPATATPEPAHPIPTPQPLPETQAPQPTHHSFDLGPLVTAFQEETEQYITILNKGFLEIERNAFTPEIITEMMRTAHSLKGNSMMLGLTPISETAHIMEDIMGEIGKGKLPTAGEPVDALFAGLDAIQTSLRSLVHNGTMQDISHIITRLKTALAHQPPAPAEPIQAPEPTPPASPQLPPPVATPPPPAPTPNPSPQAVAAPKKTPPKKNKAVDEAIRIKTSKLDKLVSLVEEMILNQRESEERVRLLRNMIVNTKQIQLIWHQTRQKISDKSETHHVQELNESIKTMNTDMKMLFKEFKNITAHGALIMQGLQQDIMEMRMLPLSTIFDAYPRAVRDLARQCGKKINLVIRGADTPLDKSIIEEISDPMVHLVRNAVDHGAETPEVRLAAGKSETATIEITALQQGDHVTIKIQDDGKGIDANVIRNIAIQRGLIDETKASALSDKEIIQFILEPGFSTAKKVTDISGRGVGMDVVKKAVESVKGQIFIETRQGKGSVFVLNLPLALAITRALLIRAAGETFALPTSAVRETIRITPSQIHQIVDKNVIRLRGQTIPLVKLSSLLRLKGQDQFVSMQAFPVVILKSQTQIIGVIVDEILEELEIVLKNLGGHLTNIKTVAGATILGGGAVIIILQALHLEELARDRSGSVFNLTEDKQPPPTVLPEALAGHRILLVEDSFNIREMQKMILEASGYSVDTAPNGADGLALALDNDYDLVITDVDMPVMDGFELTEKFKHSEKGKKTPVIIVTARESSEDHERGKRAGASAYMEKAAFDQGTLVETVQHLISH